MVLSYLKATARRTLHASPGLVDRGLLRVCKGMRGPRARLQWHSAAPRRPPRRAASPPGSGQKKPGLSRVKSCDQLGESVIAVSGRSFRLDRRMRQVSGAVYRQEPAPPGDNFLTLQVVGAQRKTRPKSGRVVRFAIALGGADRSGWIGRSTAGSSSVSGGVGAMAATTGHRRQCSARPLAPENRELAGRCHRIRGSWEAVCVGLLCSAVLIRQPPDKRTLTGAPASGRINPPPAR